MNRRLLVPAMVLLLGLVAATEGRPQSSTEPSSAGASNEPFEFALIGDYPYYPRDFAGMPHLVEELREDDSIRFVVHVGDLHSPQETDCSEALFRDRRKTLLAIGHPLIFTPGDNDWADCEGDPVDWLATLRRVFFSDPGRAAGADGFALRSQSEGDDFSDLVENALWERDGVVFATLHMIAPDPRKIFDGSGVTRARLIRASEAWLDEVFRVAAEHDARGVFLATQISLWQVSGNPQWMNLLHPELLEPYPVYSDFKARLIQHTRAFQRPVVLANGDTHSFRVDKPLFDETLETVQTFTRVEGFGSPQGHWVRIRVEPDRPEVFSFRQELVTQNLYSLVPREERTDGFEDQDFGALLWVARILQAGSKILMWVGAFTLISWGVRRLRRFRAERE